MNSQELRGLQEAYSQVYELDEAGKKVGSNLPPNVTLGTAPKGGGNSAQDVTDDPNSKPIAARSRNYTIGGGTRYGIAGIGLADSFDLYDIILSHLLDEGYADTQEQAEAIMVNMSEDWRESIVEGVFDFLPKQTTAIPGKYGKNSVLSKKDGVEGVSDKSKPGSFTPQKGGFDRMDAERYGAEQIKKGSNVGDINLAGRRETPGRVK